MDETTHIEWTAATWNPVVSPGCTNCYAMRLAGTRLRDNPSRGLTNYDGATLGSLNATAEELSAAATACGWAWDGGAPLIRWSRELLAANPPEPR